MEKRTAPRTCPLTPARFLFLMERLSRRSSDSRGRFELEEVEAAAAERREDHALPIRALFSDVVPCGFRKALRRMPTASSSCPEGCDLASCRRASSELMFVFSKFAENDIRCLDRRQCHEKSKVLHQETLAAYIDFAQLWHHREGHLHCRDSGFKSVCCVLSRQARPQCFFMVTLRICA